MGQSRVLIVEDESIIAEDLTQSLEGMGYVVSSVASSGAEAIRLAQENPPDIVLMDIRIKGEMDGVETARLIQENLNVPVVYHTAYADEVTFQRAKITEPFGYIVKPYEARELQIAIEMALYKFRAEAQLRNAEKWLSTVLSSIGDAILATDNNGILKFMNPVAEKLLGARQDGSLGKPFAEIYKTLSELNPEKTSDVLSNVFLDGNAEARDGLLLVSHNGRNVQIEENIAPIKDDKNKVTGAVVVFRDVTERKQAEVQLRGRLRVAEIKYRTLVDQIPAVTYISSGGNIVYVSPQVESMFGFSQEECLANPELLINRIQEDSERISRQRFLENADGKLFRSEYRLIAKDGSPVWVLDTAVKIKDEKGELLFLQGVMLNITDTKNAEMQLRASHDQMQALSARLQAVREEERTRIAREIHDQLGQELTVIRMDLAMLNRTLAESSSPVSRRRLTREITSILDVVGRAITTVQKIATELRPEMLDHLGLKAAMEWQAQEFQTHTGIRCSFPSNVEHVIINSDAATAVFRIFQETLTNVARHAGATEVHVTLNVANGTLLMEIADNGIGIDPGCLSHPKSLGLLGMRERARIFGGEFEIRGEKGNGTVVRLTLPLYS